MSKARKSRPPGGAQAVEEALQRFKPLLGEPDFDLLLDELRHPLMQALRVNMLKNPDPQEAAARLTQLYGWQLSSVPYCPAGWQIEPDENADSPAAGISQAGKPGLTGKLSQTGKPGQTIEHRMGYYYIQDAASMLPVSLFQIDPAEQPLILDMAASPGGKTTHLIDRSLDQGFVLANDPGRERITMLRLVLQNWGALNTAVTRFPGEKFGRWYPETFDMALLDAPCSMQNLRSTEARPMHAISRRELSALSVRQQQMLWSALQAVRVGGQVVYSTCSLDPQEDEVVLDAVLRRAGAAVQVRAPGDWLPPEAAGLQKALIDGAALDFDPQVRNAVRLWPHVLKTSGFFAALLVKVSPLPPEREAPPAVAAPADLAPLKTRDARGVVTQLLDRYGFDFQTVLDRQDLRLWQRKNILYAIPNVWGRHFDRLPFQAVGMRIAEIDNGLLPSHEWLARFGGAFTRGVYPLADEHIPAWLRGEDLPLDDIPGLPADGVLAVRDRLGRLYGRGRLSTGRLRNLLPARLVG